MLNDYKGLKLIASSNPHIRNNEDTRSIMLDVIIALCPALIMSVIRFGFRALIRFMHRGSALSTHLLHFLGPRIQLPLLMQNLSTRCMQLRFRFGELGFD